MSNKLIVADLDYDTILANLKNFLRSQSEFTDYDFEGSGINVLLRILAYNTHYQAYYLNMVANESFLDTAQLRSSVVSHAKALGYTPHSKRAPKAVINFAVTSGNSVNGKLTIPRGYAFLSNMIDGKSYKFIVINDKTVSKVGNRYVFEDLEIYEGQLVNYQYIQDDQTNPGRIFTLPDANIDTSSIRVTVSPSIGNSSVLNFVEADDIVNITDTSQVYFLQEKIDGKYQIYFGNDTVGKSVPDGGVINITYLVTNGDAANKSNNFIGTASLSDSLSESLSSFTITPVSEAIGGCDKETVDDIKHAAPISYASQNRLVSQKDYEVYLKNKLAYVDSVSVWGGEDESPPVFGKVFVAIKTKVNYYLSETEKNYIIESIIKPKAVLNIRSEIIDPEYLFLKVMLDIQYDPSTTSLTNEELKNQVVNVVQLYNETYLNKFGSRFVLSKLLEDVNNVNTETIIGCDATINVEKRIEPNFGSVDNYIVDFGVPLKQGVYSSKLITSEFKTYDGIILRDVIIEESPNSFTGITSIKILDPGTKYTSTPTVTIRGDGTGATAEAVVVNGKIEKVEITNPGIDYSYATVTLSGGGTGYGFLGEAVIDNRIGTLRVVFYNDQGERQIVRRNIGQIDYDKGRLTINDLNILSTETSDQLIRFSCPVNTGIISTIRNSIVNIDAEDPHSVIVNLNAI